MTYVLDTNAVSALMRGDAHAVHRLASLSPADVFVPQPVIAEIEYGLQRLPASKRRSSLRARFDLVSGALQRIAWTDEVSHAYGQIKSTLEKRGERLEDFDVAIAAHARAAAATLVTANVGHMLRVPGLRVERWGR